MFDFHEKRKIRRILYSKITIIALFLLSVLLSISAYNRYVVASDMNAKLEMKQAELERLQQRAQVLESKVQFLEEDRGIEEELRNRFDVAKEGEQVIILLDERENQNKQVTDLNSSDTPLEDGEEEGTFFSFFKFWD